MAIERKTQQKIAVSFSAFGQKVKKPFKVPYTWESFKNMDSVREAKAELSEKQQLKAINAALQAAARSAALNAAYEAAGYEKKTAANDEQIRLKDFVKTLMLSKNTDGSPKYTLAEARAHAVTFVGAEWADDDEDDTDEDETEETAEAAAEEADDTTPAQ